MPSPRVGEAEHEIPELGGWAIIPVAAEQVGLSRQWLSDMAHAGKLKSARRVRGTGERPAAILVRTAEVIQLKQSVEDAKTCAECRKLRNAGTAPQFCEHQTRPEIEPDQELAEPVAVLA